MTSETSVAGALLVASLILASTTDAADKAAAVLKDGRDKEVGKAEFDCHPERGLDTPRSHRHFSRGACLPCACDWQM